ncbi:hypothetical protein Ae168Ps1_1519 [Pseudonocardia sp. Ae168_Ps1]|nr:hypothetical protein Ae150APs1_1514 [Pseudonocardia sp. Ae150A_Ps1]OLL79113.1 hypothetical protein Ae168Ps1_1519 [Pseudonocardia sp. Ae168_Ps1]
MGAERIRGPTVSAHARRFRRCSPDRVSAARIREPRCSPDPQTLTDYAAAHRIA